MKRYKKYKDSGIEWLGDIPEHWEVTLLNRNLTKITNGYVGPTREIMRPDGVPYIQGIHIKNNSIFCIGSAETGISCCLSKVDI